MRQSRKRVHITIPRNVYEDFNLVAKLSGNSKAQLLREILEKKISSELSISTVSSEIPKVTFSLYVENHLLLQNKNVNRSKLFSAFIEAYASDYLRKYFHSFLFEFLNSKTSLSNPIIKKERGNVYFKVCEDILLHPNSSAFFVFNPDTFFKFFDYKYDNEKYIPKRLSKSITAKRLVSHSTFDNKILDQDKRLQGITKFLPPGINFQNNFVFYQGKLAILKGDEQEGFWIYDKQIAKKFKSYLYTLYELGY